MDITRLTDGQFGLEKGPFFLFWIEAPLGALKKGVVAFFSSPFCGLRCR
jgi:hypothetical protein